MPALAKILLKASTICVEELRVGGRFPGILESEDTTAMRALEPTAGNGLGACGVPTDVGVVEGVGELLPCWEARHEGGMMSRT